MARVRYSVTLDTASRFAIRWFQISRKCDSIATKYTKQIYFILSVIKSNWMCYNTPRCNIFYPCFPFLQRPEWNPNISGSPISQVITDSRCACRLASGGTIWVMLVYKDPDGIKIDSVGTNRRKCRAVGRNVVFQLDSLKTTKWHY